jgi:hypothetical protein
LGAHGPGGFQYALPRIQDGNHTLVIDITFRVYCFGLASTTQYDPEVRNVNVFPKGIPTAMVLQFAGDAPAFQG